ncbi:MAG: ribonuclease J [Fusobacteriaceae bacterium]
MKEKENIETSELTANLKNIREELENLKTVKKSEIESDEEVVLEEKKTFKKPRNKTRKPALKKEQELEKDLNPTLKEELKSEEKILEKKENKDEKMYVIPLGGTDEVGKNMLVVQYRDEIIIIDCGVIFPDENLPGIDLVIPDFSYLENNKNKIKGLFITHGHEDHIGSIPYLYQKIDKSIPMYGGKLTLALVKSKFEGINLSKDIPKGKEVKGRSKIKAGKYFTVEFIRVTHSIADAFAIAVTTPAGTILNTGDFKIDLTPVDGQGVDFARLSQLGEQGIDLLLSDSTNSEVEGFTPSEKSVGESLKNEFMKAKGRIIIAAFASHIHRLQQIVDISHKNGRKIAIDGRSMIRVFDIAAGLGYLKVPENLIVPMNEVDKMKDGKVVVLCTGTQGEPLAALSRIAKGMHKHIKVKSGDTVIISATPIPGNEKAVSTNINFLAKEEVNIVFRKIAGIHVSGHAAKEEQKLMINLTKPKHFMPIHGEYKMLKAHRDSAIETGIDKNNIIIALNGSKVEVTKSKVRIAGRVNSGVTLVDGLGIGDIGNSVIKDRQQLSQDGVVVIVFTLNKETRKVVAGPEITTRGFIYSKESEQLMADSIENIKQRLKVYENSNVGDLNVLKNSVRDIASKHFYSKIKRNPVILPVIMEV